MPEPIERASAPHYVWGEVSDGWRLVDRPDLSVIEERVPPGAGEQWHLHAGARQFFYILAGDALLRTVEGEVSLTPGVGVEIPPGLAHQFVNAGSADVRFLVISAPSTRGDRAPATPPAAAQGQAGHAGPAGPAAVG